MDSAVKHKELGDSWGIIMIEDDECADESTTNNEPEKHTKVNLKRVMQPKYTRDELLYTNIGMTIAEEKGVFDDDGDQVEFYFYKIIKIWRFPMAPAIARGSNVVYEDGKYRRWQKNCTIRILEIWQFTMM